MKRLSLVMILMAAWVSTGVCAWNPNDVVTTTTGYLEFTFRDPNYDSQGNLSPGRGRVDIYRFQVWVPGAIKPVISVDYARGADTKGNVMTITTSGSQRIGVEGDYEVTVTLVQVNGGTESWSPPTARVKVQYRVPPPPVILPTPLSYDDILFVREPEDETEF